MEAVGKDKIAIPYSISPYGFRKGRVEHAVVPGDVRARRLEEWVDAYADAVLRVCYLYLGDYHLAQDARQDTFLKAWKAMAQYEKNAAGHEKAWLMRIAVNTCKDYRRGAWFRRVDKRTALEDLPLRLTAEDGQDRALTMDVMRLPDRLKQVILLHFYQNLTIQETAQALGIPKSTAYRRLARAEEELKETLTGGEAR